MCIDFQSIIFILILFKFSVAPAVGNASLSIVLYLITNWPSDSKQGNNERTFNSESVTASSTLLGHKFVSASFTWHWQMREMNMLTSLFFSVMFRCYVPHCPYLFLQRSFYFSTFFLNIYNQRFAVFIRVDDIVIPFLFFFTNSLFVTQSSVFSLWRVI